MLRGPPLLPQLSLHMDAFVRLCHKIPWPLFPQGLDSTKIFFFFAQKELFAFWGSFPKPKDFQFYQQVWDLSGCFQVTIFQCIQASRHKPKHESGLLFLPQKPAATKDVCNNY